MLLKTLWDTLDEEPTEQLEAFQTSSLSNILLCIICHMLNFKKNIYMFLFHLHSTPQYDNTEMEFYLAKLKYRHWESESALIWSTFGSGYSLQPSQV